MDITRAKTVLILTFLFLNIFLGYQILQDEGRGNLGAFGRKEEISRLELVLHEAGLTLETSLPRGGICVAHLVVEPWVFHPAEIISQLKAILKSGDLALSAVSEEISNDLYKGEAGRDNALTVTFNLGDYKLILRKEGSLALRNNAAENNHQQKQNIEEMQQSAEEFVRAIPFLNGFLFDFLQESQRGPVLNYRQEYDGYPLYAGYLQLYWDGPELLGFNLYRLEPLGFAEQIREVIPPSTALMRFLEDYKGRGGKASIIEISLGYYSQEYDAERWEIPPVWRMRLNNGEVYYVNAFTGNLER